MTTKHLGRYFGKILSEQIEQMVAEDKKLPDEPVAHIASAVNEAEVSPIEKDFARHVANGAKANGAINGKKHYRNAISTLNVMKPAAKRRALDSLPTEHKAWLTKAQEIYDIESPK